MSRYNVLFWLFFYFFLFFPYFPPADSPIWALNAGLRATKKARIAASGKTFAL
jgi:hypothetical protein